MGEDPRPRSWQAAHKHDLVTTEGRKGVVHASCGCKGWGDKFACYDDAAAEWRRHARGVVNAKWERTGFFSRSLSELWNGKPDPPK